uniref:snRNA-activating protein complex subunit 3 n=1 Tax=Angiostrongylus cantonensis TaxID=6313 RepID=A0A158P5R2_ANGCA
MMKFMTWNTVILAEQTACLHEFVGNRYQVGSKRESGQEDTFLADIEGARKTGFGGTSYNVLTYMVAAVADQKDLPPCAQFETRTVVDPGIGFLLAVLPYRNAGLHVGLGNPAGHEVYSVSPPRALPSLLEWRSIDVEKPPLINDWLVERLRLNELLATRQYKCDRSLQFGDTSESFTVCDESGAINRVFIVTGNPSSPSKFERDIKAEKWTVFLPEGSDLIEHLGGDVEVHYLTELNDWNHWMTWDIEYAIRGRTYDIAKLNLYAFQFHSFDQPHVNMTARHLALTINVESVASSDAIRVLGEWSVPGIVSVRENVGQFNWIGGSDGGEMVDIAEDQLQAIMAIADEHVGIFNSEEARSSLKKSVRKDEVIYVKYVRAREALQSRILLMSEALKEDWLNFQVKFDMAMDKIFDFDNQEEFMAKAIESRDNLERCGLKMGYSDNWKDDLVSSLRRLNMCNDGIGEVMYQLVTNVIKEFRHPTKQYNFDKDDGRGRLAIPKKTPLMSMQILLTENEKRRNPHYKSIVLRSMKYDHFDPTVISRCVRTKPKTEATFINNASSSGAQDINNEHTAGIQEITPTSEEVVTIELGQSGTAVGQFRHHEGRSAFSANVRKPPSQAEDTILVYNPYEDLLQAQSASAAMACTDYNNNYFNNQSCKVLENDIVVEVSIHVGYPRPLEKEEQRLGRLLKVVDRFLVLGSNTLKELKNSIDCRADYHVFDDVSQRFLTDEDLCKSKAVTLRRICGYLLQKLERLITPFSDDIHPKGPYPLLFYELNTRRIACAGCKMATSEWVVWNHECTPVPVQYFCESCYNDLNFDVSGKGTFNFKAAPLYDRHNRKTDIEMQKRFLLSYKCYEFESGYQFE